MPAEKPLSRFRDQPQSQFPSQPPFRTPRNLGHIRDINRNIILRTIWKNREISRAELARHTHLTKTTVSSLVADLVELRLVKELSEPDTAQEIKPGRKPIHLTIDRDAAFCIAVDLKPREILVASYDALVDRLGYRRLMKSNSNPTDTIRQIIDAVKSLSKDAGRELSRISAIGVSVPGKAEYDGGKIISCPLLNWFDVDLRALLLADLPHEIAVRLDCDAPLALRTEMWHDRALHETSTAVYVLVNETVNAGIALTGKLYHGRAYSAGSFAHMQVTVDGLQCYCGNRGCWESYVSTEKLLRDYFGSEWGDRDTVQAVSDLRQAYISGEEKALNVIDEEAAWLAVGLANIFNSVDPETIVIGGYIRLLWDLMENNVTEQVRRRLTPTHGWLNKGNQPKRIVGSTLNPKDNLEGAALLAISTIIPVDLFQDLVVLNMERLEEKLF